MTTKSPNARCSVAFFGHDCTELTVIKRARAFMENGLKVRGFTFRRERLNRAYRPEWDDLNLGTTEDARYGQRLIAMLTALPRLVHARQRLRGCDMLYARNIDMAALALLARWFSGSNAPFVYEVLDVQRLMTRRGAAGTVLRFFERRILKRTDLLVVSSGGFVREYFRPVQRFDGPWFLLENKIFGLDPAGLGARPEPDAPPATPCPPDGPWVIAWLGNLRCPRSLDLLCEIASTLGERVRIQIHGKPVVAGEAHFKERIKGLDNVVFAGEYRSPDDLPLIYRQMHFAWAFDWYEAGANSNWLLPNRLYEAGFFGVPSIALAGTETARWISEQGCGWTVNEPVAPAVVELLRALDRDAYLQRRRALLELPHGSFVDEGDTGAMIRLALVSGRHPAPAGPIDTPPAPVSV